MYKDSSINFVILTKCEIFERYYYFDTHGRDSVIPLLIFNTDILHLPPYRSSIGVIFGDN